MKIVFKITKIKMNTNNKQSVDAKLMQHYHGYTRYIALLLQIGVFVFVAT